MKSSPIVGCSAKPAKVKGALGLLLIAAILAWSAWFTPAKANLMDEARGLLTQAQNTTDEGQQSRLLQHALGCLNAAHNSHKLVAIPFVQSAIAALQRHDSSEMARDITQALAAIGGPAPAAVPGAPVASNPVGTPAPIPPQEHATPTVKLTEDQARAVVLIKGDNAEGTGFLVKTPDGPVVITNLHVIADNPNLKITTNTGALINVISMKGASDRDIAVLAIKDDNYSYLEMAPDISAIVQPGDEVITPGNSEGGEVMLNTAGKILGIGPERIEFDNPIYHGNSGGPVFHTKSGKVLGVVTEAMKVENSDDLDRASFASRHSAISGAMRYFGLRLDTITGWVPIDSQSFQVETTFLDQFHEQSLRLDAYLNTSDKRDAGDSNGAVDDSKIYLNDEKIMRANDRFEDQAAGSDTEQRIELLHEFLLELQGIADTNVAQIENTDNFYSFDRGRARDELAYRKALRAELDTIGNNIDRLGHLPRTNN